MEKKLSIRIRQNDFKRVSKGGKTYKSIVEQISHDYRTEKIDSGYLTNPKNTNVYQSHNELRNDNNTLDIENVKDNIHKLFDKVKQDYKENNNNRSWQKKTKPFLTGVISFSSGFMLDIEESKIFNQKLNQFIQETFSQKLTCVLHRDEKSLHFHFTIFNYDFKTHKTIGRNINTSELQDKLFDFLNKQDLTYGHKRGESKKLTNAKHLEIMEGKKIELDNQSKIIENQKEDIKELENINKKQKNIMEELSSDIKSMREYNQNLENDKYKLIEEGKKIKNELYEELQNICEDIIKMGEEDKGQGILKTAQNYFNKDQDTRFNKLFKKAQNIKSAIQRNMK
jgi:hypothetical protein